MISGGTVWNFFRNVWDLICEGYWSSVQAIHDHPHITFWVVGLYVFYRTACGIAGFF